MFGPTGSGKFMSRNHIARHILKSVAGPVVIVFTSEGEYIVVVSRKGD